MQLHALNYMTITHPLHDITWYGTFDSRRLHKLTQSLHRITYQLHNIT